MLVAADVVLLIFVFVPIEHEAVDVEVLFPLPSRTVPKAPPTVTGETDKGDRPPLSVRSFWGDIFMGEVVDELHVTPEDTIVSTNAPADFDVKRWLGSSDRWAEGLEPFKTSANDLEPLAFETQFSLDMVVPNSSVRRSAKSQRQQSQTDKHEKKKRIAVQVKRQKILEPPLLRTPKLQYPN